MYSSQEDIYYQEALEVLKKVGFKRKQNSEILRKNTTLQKAIIELYKLGSNDPKQFDQLLTIPFLSPALNYLKKIGYENIKDKWDSLIKISEDIFYLQHINEDTFFTLEANLEKKDYLFDELDILINAVRFNKDQLERANQHGPNEEHYNKFANHLVKKLFKLENSPLLNHSTKEKLANIKTNIKKVDYRVEDPNLAIEIALDTQEKIHSSSNYIVRNWNSIYIKPIILEFKINPEKLDPSWRPIKQQPLKMEVAQNEILKSSLYAESINRWNENKNNTPSFSVLSDVKANGDCFYRATFSGICITAGAHKNFNAIRDLLAGFPGINTIAKNVQLLTAEERGILVSSLTDSQFPNLKDEQNKIKQKQKDIKSNGDQVFNEVMKIFLDKIEWGDSDALLYMYNQLTSQSNPLFAQVAIAYLRYLATKELKENPQRLLGGSTYSEQAYLAYCDKTGNYVGEEAGFEFYLQEIAGRMGQYTDHILVSILSSRIFPFLEQTTLNFKDGKLALAEKDESAQIKWVGEENQEEKEKVKVYTLYNGAEHYLYLLSQDTVEAAKHNKFIFPWKVQESIDLPLAHEFDPTEKTQFLSEVQEIEAQVIDKISHSQKIKDASKIYESAKTEISMHFKSVSQKVELSIISEKFDSINKNIDMAYDKKQAEINFQKLFDDISKFGKEESCNFDQFKDSYHLLSLRIISFREKYQDLINDISHPMSQENLLNFATALTLLTDTLSEAYNKQVEKFKYLTSLEDTFLSIIASLNLNHYTPDSSNGVDFLKKDYLELLINKLEGIIEEKVGYGTSSLLDEVEILHQYLTQELTKLESTPKPNPENTIHLITPSFFLKTCSVFAALGGAVLIAASFIFNPTFIPFILSGGSLLIAAGLFSHFSKRGPQSSEEPSELIKSTLPTT